MCDSNHYTYQFHDCEAFVAICICFLSPSNLLVLKNENVIQLILIAIYISRLQIQIGIREAKNLILLQKYKEKDTPYPNFKTILQAVLKEMFSLNDNQFMLQSRLESSLNSHSIARISPSPSWDDSLDLTKAVRRQLMHESLTTSLQEKHILLLYKRSKIRYQSACQEENQA